MTSPVIRVLAFLALFNLVALGYSLTANLHIHVTENGRVIAHGHPHSEKGNNGGQHSHSQFEVTCLANLGKILHSFLVLFFFALLAAFSVSHIKPPGQTPFADSKFHSHDLVRGPPVSLQYSTGY
jgi:hypothetical protein